MARRSDAPRNVETATELCLRLLAARARTRHQLNEALEKKGCEESVRLETLAKLSRLGYLDDVRFARARISGLLRDGRLGPGAILEKLCREGVPEALARATLAEEAEALHFDVDAAARRVLESRGLLGRALEPREHARAARLLASRGFAADVVRRALVEAGLDPSELDD